MSQTTLNLVAITIFTLVMMSLLGPLLHLSPVVPAIATFGVLSLATLDNLSWQGRAGTLIVDWFNRFSPEHQMRVIQHEAGHFLAAHLLNIPVTGYTLSAWEAFRQGQPGFGGVSFNAEELEIAVEQGSLPAQLLDRYCIILMAGIAAEMMVYGNTTGGADDRQSLRILWTRLQRPVAEVELKQRWATLQAKTLLEEHRTAYDSLVLAMEHRATVEECYRAIEEKQVEA